MTEIVRFAPSPTGMIHIGNARTALWNWLYAKARKGAFILRYDDTDVERSRQEYADGIAEDLAWLGIQPDRVERQSSRFDRYDAAMQTLIEAGRLYKCYETPEELDLKRKRRLSRGLPPVYDRAALKMSDEDCEKLEAEGRKPYWRFLLNNYDENVFEPRKTEVVWDDLVRGRQVVDLASVSDPVVIRTDGTYLYTLPSVVDDIDMGVTTIIRGDDHVTNTGVQFDLFKALGSEMPKFGHHNLLTSATGEGLSKRTGALSIRSLAEAGTEPMAVASLAVLIGTSKPVEAARSLAELTEKVDIADITKGAAKFDPEELKSLSAKILHETDYEAVAGKLALQGIEGEAAAPFWTIIRANIESVGEAGAFWPIIAGNITPVALPDDEAFLMEAAQYLPEGEWSEETWGQWTKVLKAETGRKGKQLFLPLRRALTGLSHGPELKALLPLIGDRNTRDRLAGPFVPPAS